MLTKSLFCLCLLCACAGPVSHAAAQTAPRGAKPGPAQKPAAQRERTPAEQARDEWNRGAVAYRTGRFAEAQRHFERVRELDPKMKDVRLYIARSVARQYRPGVEDPENVAKGEEAVAAYEALLAEEPANDEAFKGLVSLLGQMRSPDRVRDAVLRRANDASLPAAKRVDALVGLMAPDLKCSRDVTERRENKESTEQGGTTTPKYKMPADTGDFYRAQQCATNGLGYAEQALLLAPDSVPALTHRAGFVRELAKLAEMEGNTGQKDFYDAQHAETAERLRALGVPTGAGPTNANVRAQSGDGAAQPGGGGAGAGGRVVNGGVLNGKATHKPEPDYPSIARAARADGTVVVNVVVDEEGAVVSASAVSGHPLLQQAAVSAARQARFSPTLLSGQPVRVSGTLTYTFTLD